MTLPNIIRTQNITFLEMANAVTAYIKGAIANYGNLNNIIPNSKNGQSYTMTSRGISNISSSSYVTCVATMKVVNGVVAVSEDTIDSNMSYFLSSVLKLDNTHLFKNVDNKNYFNYLSDLLSFCTTKMAILVSDTQGGTSPKLPSTVTGNTTGAGGIHTTYTNATVSEGTQLVYIPSNTDFSNIIAIDLNSIDEEIVEEDPTTWGLTYSQTELNNQIKTIIETECIGKYKTLQYSISCSIARTT